MAAISVMLRLGESSMKSGARLTSAAVWISRRLSSRVELAVAQAVAVDAGTRAEQPVAQFEGRHFEADEQHRLCPGRARRSRRARRC